MSIDVHTHAVPPQVLTALERDDGKCGVRVDGVDAKHVVYVATGGPVSSSPG